MLCCLVTKSCPTLCHSMDCSPPGSSVHGISQARLLVWVTISFSRGSSRSRDQSQVFCLGWWIRYHWATWEALRIIISLLFSTQPSLSRRPKDPGYRKKTVYTGWLDWWNICLLPTPRKDQKSERGDVCIYWLHVLLSSTKSSLSG